MIRALIGLAFVLYEIVAYFKGWPLVSHWTGAPRVARDIWHAELGEHLRRESTWKH